MAVCGAASPPGRQSAVARLEPSGTYAQRVRFIGVPRSVLKTAIGEMDGWRHLADRILSEAKATCPVGDRTDERKAGEPHLKDSLEARVITGPDARILVGSKSRGDVLAYVHQGTEAHTIPVPSGIVAFIPKGGVMTFRAVDQVDHPGTTANPFVLEAMRRAIAGR